MLNIASTDAISVLLDNQRFKYCKQSCNGLLVMLKPSKYFIMLVVPKFAGKVAEGTESCP